MKNYVFVFSLLLLTHAVRSANVSLLELVKQKKIKVEAVSKGGFQGEVLTVTLKNLTYQPVEGIMESGNVFQSEDASAQNLIILVAINFRLKPSETQNLLAYTNCIEPNDYAPYLNTKFSLLSSVDPQLVGLAKLATSKKLKEQMQGYMWSIVRKQKIYQYTAADSIENWPIFEYLSNFAKVEKYHPPVPPKPKFVYSTRINFTQNIETSSNYSLLCKDQSGNILREYYKNKTISGGIYSVTVGFNDMVEDTTMKLTYQLLNTENEIVAEKTVKNGFLEAKAKVFLLKTIFQYEVNEPINKASLKLYDPNDKLIHVLYEDKKIPLGIRRSPYSFYHTFGKKSTFKAKLFDEKNNLIKVIEINGASSEEIK